MLKKMECDGWLLMDSHRPPIMITPSSRFWTQVVTQALYRPSTLRWMTSLEQPGATAVFWNRVEGTSTLLGRWKKVTPSQLERRIDLAITDNCIGSYSNRS